MKYALAVLAVLAPAAAYAQTDLPDSTTIIDVGSSALWAEISGGSVYVSNPTDGTITVLDAASGAVTGAIASEPGVAVLKIADGKLYTTVGGDAAVRVYDLATGGESARIEIGQPDITLSSTADQPYGQREYVTFSTDSLGIAHSGFYGNLYAVHSTVGRVVAIDLASGRATAEIPVGKTPLLMVIDEKRNAGYVTNYESSSVSVIDLFTNEVVKTLQTGFAPAQMAIDPDVDRLYVTHHASPHVAAIDLAGQEVAARINVGAPTHAVALDRQMGLLHVTRLPESGVTGAGQPGRVDFIDTFDNRVSGGFELPENPFTIAVDPGSRMLYATVIKDGNVVAVDLSLDEEYLQVAPDSGSPQPEGGGCLIATASYGTEMAGQVQKLREARDVVSSTGPGSAFMAGFNSAYYAFSPSVADMQRENPALREAVRALIAPMVYSLQLVELAGTEAQVLALGSAAIALNLGLYAGLPAAAFVAARRRLS